MWRQSRAACTAEHPTRRLLLRVALRGAFVDGVRLRSAQERSFAMPVAGSQGSFALDAITWVLLIAFYAGVLYALIGVLLLPVWGSARRSAPGGLSAPGAAGGRCRAGYWTAPGRRLTISP